METLSTALTNEAYSILLQSDKPSLAKKSQTPRHHRELCLRSLLMQSLPFCHIRSSQVSHSTLRQRKLPCHRRQSLCFAIGWSILPAVNYRWLSDQDQTQSKQWSSMLLRATLGVFPRLHHCFNVFLFYRLGNDVVDDLPLKRKRQVSE